MIVKLDAIKATIDGIVSRGVKSVAINQNGHLIFTMTDNSTVDLGNVICPGTEMRYQNGIIQWKHEGDASWNDLLNVPEQIVDPAITGAIAGAVAAQTAAEAAQTAAATSKNQAANSAFFAKTSMDGAITAMNRAEAAQTAAETAQAGAVTAQTTAVSAKTAAVEAKEAAVAAQAGAVTAQTTAVSAKTTAVEAKEAAAAAQNEAELAADNAGAYYRALTNMGVSAYSRPSGSEASVSKSEQGGIVRLTFGIPKGDKGDTGNTGQRGSDGVSPSVEVAPSSTGHIIRITDATHTETFTVEDGEKGEDGYSPEASVTVIEGGSRLTITDATGTTTVDILNGEEGPQGPQGPQGPPGSDSVKVLYRYEDTLADVKSKLENYTAAVVDTGDGKEIVLFADVLPTLVDLTTISDRVINKHRVTSSGWTDTYNILVTHKEYSPQSKTEGMTQPVGVDTDGELWTAPANLSAYRTAAAQDVIDAGKGTYSKPSGGIPKTDLASAVQTSLGLADSALQSFTETDPTVSAWAKQPNKPTYTKSEVGLGNVDNTSDATKKSNFTGSIASGNNGFVTGGDVYAAIGNVEAALAALR